LLQPARAARLAWQADRNATLPGLSEVLESVSASVLTGVSWASDGYGRAVQRAVQSAWADALVSVLTGGRASVRVRVTVDSELRRLTLALNNASPPMDAESARFVSFLSRKFDAAVRSGPVYAASSLVLAADPLPLGPPIGAL
jgi:hypothetical protein